MTGLDCPGTHMTHCFGGHRGLLRQLSLGHVSIFLGLWGPFRRLEASLPRITVMLEQGENDPRKRCTVLRSSSMAPVEPGHRLCFPTVLGAFGFQYQPIHEDDLCL